MRRDGIDAGEAQSRIDECKRRLEEEALEDGDYECAIDILADELGLEPDYMFDLLL